MTSIGSNKNHMGIDSSGKNKFVTNSEKLIVNGKSTTDEARSKI